MICGARQTPSYFCVGGVRWDAPPGWVDAVRAFVNEFPRHRADYETMLTKNPIFKSRTVGIGVLSREDANQLIDNLTVLMFFNDPFHWVFSSSKNVPDRQNDKPNSVSR